MESRNALATASAMAVLIVLAQLAAGQGNRAYILDVEYDKGSFKFNNIFIKSVASLPGSVFQDSPYKFSVVSFDGGELASSRFGIPDTIIAESGVEVLDKVNLTLGVQYFPNAKEIRLLGGSNETLLQINVTVFAEDLPKPAAAFPIELVAIAIGVVVAGILVYFFIFSRRREAAQNPFRLS